MDLFNKFTQNEDKTPLRIIGECILFGGFSGFSAQALKNYKIYLKQAQQTVSNNKSQIITKFSMAGSCYLFFAISLYQLGYFMFNSKASGRYKSQDDGSGEIYFKFIFRDNLIFEKTKKW